MTNLVKKHFTFNLRVMRFFGLYPPKTYRKLYKLYSYVVYICIIVPIPVLMLWYLLDEDEVDLTLVAQNAFGLCEIGCLIFKLLQFITNAENVRKSISLMVSPIFLEYTTKQESIMNDSVRVCTRNTKFYFFVCCLTYVSWAVVPLFGKEYKLPLDIFLPFDITHGGLSYVLSYILLVTGVLVDNVSTAAVDPLIGGLPYFATAQIKILKDNLKNLSNIDPELVYNKITFCVKHHKMILDFVEMYENTFSPIVFTQFAASVFVICVSCLQLSIVQPFTVSFFSMVIFINAVLMQILIYCYYGTALYEESNLISTAAYMSDWYEFEPKSKRALLILMKRCKKPIKVSVGKILDLSLDTFTTILRRSYSLLAVLNNY